MMAAISAARAGADVCILEHNDKLGKKILATGNGRCNFTNRLQEPCCYRSSQKEFPWRVMGQTLPAEQTISFFEELEIVQRPGRISVSRIGSASSAMEVLQMEVERLQIQVEYGAQIHSIRKKKERFEVGAHAKVFWPDALILATGSRASSTTGSDGRRLCVCKSIWTYADSGSPGACGAPCEREVFCFSGRCADSWKGTDFYRRKEMCREYGEIRLTNQVACGLPGEPLCCGRHLPEKRSDGSA